MISLAEIAPPSPFLLSSVPGLSPLAAEAPLVEIDGLLVKLEGSPWGGSIKDRMARYVIEESERRGLLRPGQGIVEATSGNTGVALAALGREKGYPVIVVMPGNTPAERQEAVRALGADLILSSVEGGLGEAAAVRDQLARRHGWFNPDQFANPLNVECHERTTGEELLRQLQGRRIDAFVAGVGTGGTLIGVGRRLIRDLPRLRIVAVEPEESSVLSGGCRHPHGIWGIGDGFIPELAGDGHGGPHPLIDEFVHVSTSEAEAAASELRGRFGLQLGASSGANYVAARRLAERGDRIATIFPDGYVEDGAAQVEGLDLDYDVPF